MTLARTFLAAGFLFFAAATHAAGDPALAGEIEQVLRRAEKIWDQRDSARYFDELWSSRPDVVYMSEWFYPVLWGRDAAAAYFKPAKQNLYAHRERYSNVEAVRIADDLAMATYHLRYDEHAAGRLPLGGWSRVIALFRREQGQWKILGQFDAPMSLISQVRRLQEEALSADFLEYARAQNPNYDKEVAADPAIKRRRGGLPWLGGGNTQPEPLADLVGPLSATPAAQAAPAAASASGTLVEQITAHLRRAEVIYDQNASELYFDELWSKDENLVFMSEQFYPVFYGRKAVEAYFKPPMKNLYAYRERYSNIEAQSLAPDLALATWHVRYDMHAITRIPLGGWARIVGVLRREQGAWRFVTQYETSMSAISQARRIHEESLDPDFAEFARRQNPDYDKQVTADKAIATRRAGPQWPTAPAAPAP